MRRVVGTARRLRRDHGANFIRFCAVGAIGFLVDAAVLELATRVGGLSPIAGRFVSFPVAVLATFELNRRWAFGGADAGSFGGAFLRYIGVQGIGLACNLAVFSIAYLALPAPLDMPLFCLAVASGAALLVNYTGARMVVFRAPRA